METIDFLCINCQELITQDKLLMHSIICVYPTPDVIKVDSESVSLQLKYKLEKLRSALLAHKSKDIEQIDQGLFEFLLEKAQEILGLEMNSPESLDKCDSIVHTLNRYSEAHLSPCVLLYTERLKTLAVEMIKDASKDLGPQVNSYDLKYREIQQAKLEILNEKVSATHNIDEISSQISKIWHQGSVLSSMPEEGFEDAGDLDNMIKEGENEATKKNETDLQRYFFSKCLALKLAKPAKDPVQLVQIPDLYKQAIELKVPVAKWEEFIKDKFNQIR